MKTKGWPEHEKLARVKGESQAIGAFLEWLSENGNVIAVYHEHGEGCEGPDEYQCGYRKDELTPDHQSIQQRLADYFEIDLAKLEREKRAMLEEFRGERRVAG